MLRILLIIALLPLALLAKDKQSEKKPDVHLNHAFIVPDAGTYEAIRNSDFVKQFAVWEERTTHRKDITYTGFYLYGRHTYFEFLKPDERTPVGTSKVAFGVDRTGDLDLLQKRAEAAGIKTEVKTITRAFNGKDVDWFRSLDKKEQDGPSLGIWTLEYVPKFLKEWNPSSNNQGGVRREDVLQRYARVTNQKVSSKLVLDVHFISLLLPEEQIPHALRECAVLGLQPAPKLGQWHSGQRAGCVSKEFSIIMRPPGKGQHTGIAMIGFKLSRALDARPTLRLGSSELEIVGTNAMWWIQPENLR